MNSKSEESKSSGNMELPMQESSACGPGCGCNADEPSSRTRWIIGVIVLVVAAALVARAMVKDTGVSVAPGFSALATTGETPSPALSAANETSMVAKEIGAISDLNTVAVDKDMVFVFLPGKKDTSGKAPTSQMIGAARTIQSQGLKTGLFTLKTDSLDYEQITAQETAPGVLAMVKGRGMKTVSGEITETKLIQAFVAASSAGGCGPSAGAGCCPK
jgi:hypothetical protein